MCCDWDSELLSRFAFLATAPVVFIYWLAYFVILTKGEPPQQETMQESGERSKLINEPSTYQATVEGKWLSSGGRVDVSMFLLPIETPSVQRDKEASERGESGRSEEVVGFREKGLKLLRCLRLIWWLALNVCLLSCSNTTITAL